MASSETVITAHIPEDEVPSAISVAFRKSRLAIVLIATAITWEAFSRIADVPNYLLPAPSRMLETFIEDFDLVVSAFLLTAATATIGFFVAMALGFVLAVIVARSQLMEELLYPYLNIIRVTPTIAIAPLLTIWFGHGIVPVIIVAAVITFFPIVTTAVLGLRSVDPDLVNLLRTLNASELTILRKIRIPNAMPHLFAAFRITAPLAVVGALVGEFVGSSRGLGFLLVTARGRLDTTMVFVMIALSAVLGILAFALVVAVERRLIHWHPSVLVE
jgi:ABC-type nitrate/sulfonate/bicarbonate transport system permease component